MTMICSYVARTTQEAAGYRAKTILPVFNKTILGKMRMPKFKHKRKWLNICQISICSLQGIKGVCK